MLISIRFYNLLLIFVALPMVLVVGCSSPPPANSNESADPNRRIVTGVGIASVADDAVKKARQDALASAVGAIMTMISSETLAEAEQFAHAIDDRVTIEETSRRADRLRASTILFVRDARDEGEPVIATQADGNVQATVKLSVPNSEFELSPAELAERIRTTAARWRTDDPAATAMALEVAWRMAEHWRTALDLAEALRAWVAKGGLDIARAWDAVDTAYKNAVRAANGADGGAIDDSRKSFERELQERINQAHALLGPSNMPPPTSPVEQMRAASAVPTATAPVEAYADLFVWRADDRVESAMGSETPIRVGEAVKIRVRPLREVRAVLVNFDSAGYLILQADVRVSANTEVFVPGDSEWSEIAEAGAEWDAFALLVVAPGTAAETAVDEMLATFALLAEFGGDVRGLGPNHSREWIAWLRDDAARSHRDAAVAVSTLANAQKGLVVSRPYTERAAIPVRRANSPTPAASQGRTTAIDARLRRGTEMLVLSWLLPHRR